MNNVILLCRSKNGHVSDAGNYKPLSPATIISKLFLSITLSCISPYVATTDNLFGFKATTLAGSVPAKKCTLSEYLFK